MKKIILGLTGSVATVLADKLIKSLQNEGFEVIVVMTKAATYFVKPDDLKNVKVYIDEDEWPDKPYVKNDPILHIELRKSASALVIAPLSVNTLGKIASGVCDNLLTSVYRAWDLTRPIILAPACNTLMWQHPITEKQINLIKSWGETRIVPPISKMLVCKQYGEGAMALIEDITSTVKEALRYKNPPLLNCNGVPVGNHPGAFGFNRKHSCHTGVDLYTKKGMPVYAIESGRVINIDYFTGPRVDSPWWNETKSVSIEGPSGVICYGEIKPTVKLNEVVQGGDNIGCVQQVLKKGKERADIPGHSLAMLHFELLKHGSVSASTWELNTPKPDNLLDPTSILLQLFDKKLEM